MAAHLFNARNAFFCIPVQHGKKNRMFSILDFRFLLSIFIVNIIHLFMEIFHCVRRRKMDLILFHGLVLTSQAHTKFQNIDIQTFISENSWIFAIFPFKITLFHQLTEKLALVVVNQKKNNANEIPLMYSYSLIYIYFIDHFLHLKILFLLNHINKFIK